MSFPGPEGAAWGLALGLLALAVLAIGEAIRSTLAPRVPLLRTPEPFERLLVDLYVGGGAFFLLAEVPGQFFSPGSVQILLVLGGVATLFLAVRHRRKAGDGGVAIEQWFRLLLRPSRGLVLVAVLGLYVLEVTAASAAATGNTFDSSLLATYTALLLHQHGIPLSFAPVISQGLLYPQGTTVWLGVAQVLFPLEPARTPLLVTPLFLSLSPVGAFVVGARYFGTERAGAAFGLTFALVGSWTRVMTAGSNDFVLAFPLVLILIAWSREWWRLSGISWSNALAFGALLGYSAALNPVGAQWLIPTLLIGGLLGVPAWAGSARRWFSRWFAALTVALVALAPTVYVFVDGISSPNFQTGSAAAPAGSPTGISTPHFIGAIDPYLFRPTDVWLSPLPGLRFELAVLLTLGIGVLLLVPRRAPGGGVLDPFRRFMTAGFVSAVLLIGILWAASARVPGTLAFSAVTNGDELSIWLFTLYTMFATLPLIFLFEWLAHRSGGATASPGPPPPNRSRSARRTRSPIRAVPLIFVALLLIPGVALTATELSPVLGNYYDSFGNVTPADFALLHYATSLPGGSRILVAPGSAAEFLPGYNVKLVILYPLAPGFPWVNSTYRQVAQQLVNGTLNATGLRDLSILLVNYIAVTQANSILFPPFSPAPLLADRAAFLPVFEEGDAYLFQCVGT
ncbi:MAG: hypothetical protein WAN87_08640 [Thermoplasmata archaeon]